jgi:hypothetical protein
MSGDFSGLTAFFVWIFNTTYEVMSISFVLYGFRISFADIFQMSMWLALGIWAVRVILFFNTMESRK